MFSGPAVGLKIAYIEVTRNPTTEIILFKVIWSNGTILGKDMLMAGQQSSTYFWRKRRLEAVSHPAVHGCPPLDPVSYLPSIAARYMTAGEGGKEKHRRHKK